MELLARYKVHTGFILMCVIVYIASVLLPAPDQVALDRYHISALTAKVLGLTIAIPYVFIWAVALIGYLRLRTYADQIADSKDGKAFGTIARGIWLLVLWLPLNSIVSGLSSLYYHHHPSATALLTQFNNYLTLVLLFIAFFLVHRGSVLLLKLIKKPNYNLYQPTTLIYLAFAALYTYLVLQDSVRNHAVGDTLSSYYLPDWAIVTTLIIPRLIFWYLGVQAIQHILLYRRYIKGKLYQNALQSLAYGLGGVLSMLIILRVLQSLAAPLASASLPALLLLIYLLLVAIAVGYALIARGASKLQKIEEL